MNHFLRCLIFATSDVRFKHIIGHPMDLPMTMWPPAGRLLFYFLVFHVCGFERTDRVGDLFMVEGCAIIGLRRHNHGNSIQQDQRFKLEPDMIAL